MTTKNSSNKKLLLKITLSVITGLLIFYGIIVWALFQ